MSDKPSNQSVAQLSTDDVPVSNAVSESDTQALDYLQRGLDKAQIIDKLVEDGVPRAEATRITNDLWNAQSDERRTNAYILLGVAAFIVVVSASFLALRLLNGDDLPRMSVHYLLLALAAWFMVKATNDLREL